MYTYTWVFALPVHVQRYRETDAGFPFLFSVQPVHVQRYREGIPLTAPSDPEQGGQCSLEELCRLGANTGEIFPTASRTAPREKRAAPDFLAREIFSLRLPRVVEIFFARLLSWFLCVFPSCCRSFKERVRALGHAQRAGGDGGEPPPARPGPRPPHDHDDPFIAAAQPLGGG